MAGAGTTSAFTFQEGGPIESIEHFLAEIRRFAGQGDHRLYFRGHGEPTAGLMPSIGRRHFYLGRSLIFDRETESRLLQQFRRYAYEHFGRIASEWETLFLARHHGLPTRLLDWTLNPLVALYFAAFYQNAELTAGGADREPETRLSLDGTVYAIQRRRDIAELDVLHESPPPLAIRGIKLVYPFNPSPRMTAQSGVFTLHEDPWTDLVNAAGRGFDHQSLDVAKLIRWSVPSRHKTRIVLDLERLAINSRTLFPDLDGLARGLWETELIRACFLEADASIAPA